MKFAPRLPRLAVLIDGENISSEIASRLFMEIAEFGDARLRRIYGNFARPQLKSWDDVLRRHAIHRVNVPNHTKGKNASDIALVIDAMDLLHIGNFDGFCLVSSDSDFTRLAELLRDRGTDVYGFGEKKTPQNFQRACCKFFLTDSWDSKERPVDLDRPTEEKAHKPASAAIPILDDLISQMNPQEVQVSLSALGKMMAKRGPESDCKAYGFARLSVLIRETNAYHLSPADKPVWVRAKRPNERQTTAA